MSVVAVLLFYMVMHMLIACFRAIARAKKYHNYYLSKGVIAFPRCFKKRIFHKLTFFYAFLSTLSVVVFLDILIAY